MEKTRNLPILNTYITHDNIQQTIFVRRISVFYGEYRTRCSG